MPIYEYQCKACGHNFEKLMFKGDKEAVECANCSSKRVEKLMSAGSFMGAHAGSGCGGGSTSRFS
ncbi:MAG: zinc ribbon domain-containing protein [Desulfobacterales bacterium]|nr:zinc ribbon domain-containing protein [Desulfobacterales bacterium]